LRKLLPLCAAAVFAAASAGTVLCQSPPSFVLESSSNGVYDYDLLAPEPLAIETGQTMSLTGLSGITSVELTGALANTACNGTSGLTLEGFTSTSVTLEDTGGQCFYGPGGPYSNLEIDSSVTTLGTVNFAIENPPGNFFTGTAQGPVAPEPGTGVLLIAAAALLCAGSTLRKRR